VELKDFWSHTMRTKNLKTGGNCEVLQVQNSAFDIILTKHQSACIPEEGEPFTIELYPRGYFFKMNNPLFKMSYKEYFRADLKDYVLNTIQKFLAKHG
jgi:hypothetical protein